MPDRIDLVWLKRDLRITDHDPLLYAAKSNFPTLIFIFLRNIYIRRSLLQNDILTSSANPCVIFKLFLQIRNSFIGIKKETSFPFLQTNSNQIFNQKIYLAIKKLELLGHIDGIKLSLSFALIMTYTGLNSNRMVY